MSYVDNLWVGEHKIDKQCIRLGIPHDLRTVNWILVIPGRRNMISGIYLAQKTPLAYDALWCTRIQACFVVDWDRVCVVGAHFVTIRLALNSTFRLNCQQKFNFWAAGRRKFLSSSTLLNVRYVLSPYRVTTVIQLWATGGKYCCLRRRKTHLQPIVVDCRPWRLAAGFQQQN
jgi:hypothetical protein